MPDVKIIGATGYGGLGMVELLLRHPEFRIAAVAAVRDVGKPLSSVWPYLEGFCDLPLLAPDSPEFIDAPADVVVASTPDGVGMANAPRELGAGRKFLDFSGDFRFASATLYAEYARRLGRDPRHLAPELLPRSVYGLAELHRDEIAGADLVGNPGCFAVSCILGLAPALKAGLVETAGIVCDCKSGVSGAGKKPFPAHHYPERYDSMNAYRLSGHQHVMEVERELSILAGGEIAVAFTPQAVPMCRGILSCLYGRLASGADQRKSLAAYRDFYRDSPFVLVKDADAPVATGDVRESNRCIVTVAADERTGTFRAISHIDNLLKGQAGSAAQNLNLMFGYPETLGLDRPAAHP
ncbi:MAG: N-acetyl-gamma-glutamyl-phosphate reductase [Planctomycetota bacterium]|jgi:N-acetyl-gamma-glutamyl-phosphate reductase|nr:N-acetyl-gamma-glutamyl-phosphate reductase [Planctomycetota bacterium]